MDSRSILVLLFLLMKTSCQPWRTSGIPDRRQPPPVASFLEQLLKIHGRANNGGIPQEPGLEADERPIGWQQLEEARNQPNLFRRQVSLWERRVQCFFPGHRVPRQLMASPPMRGCHLGTCQIQNLANLLYRYGGNNQKDESHKNNKGTTDPMGYGRRKRRAARHGVPTLT
ncbi:hypothetical protein JD844_001822 [Phrynosoma platyrhinos]|uniref:Uncharacterized protein n=1 Tax=Phrynosoma platyrhinos TaxID=52577 RepID=A0ABQ7TB96_PHRPL|nr:hypothetical protein JD844_001822 [Phrynosoma platyrhinos]